MKPLLQKSHCGAITRQFNFFFCITAVCCLLISSAKLAAQSIDEPIRLKGHASSLIAKTESFVIIPGDTHKDLWVHPEMVTIPGSSIGVEFRVKPTDRYGKDQHGEFTYFSTGDLFKKLTPLGQRTAPYWDRVRFTSSKLAKNDTFPVPASFSLGHAWASPYLFSDSNTLIQAFTTKEGIRNSVQSIIIKKEGNLFKPVHISNAWSVEKGRGLYEPHMAEYKGKYYMSVRAEDGHGYLLVSDDKGYTWSKPVPWKWDDGTDIPMNQTMTKLLSHSNGLVLVYTRITPDNGKTFRNRAPLFCADIDVNTLQLKKATEIAVVPDKGFCVGTFWVWPINQEESYIATAEWPRDGRLTNGDVWLVKVKWKKPNLQVTKTGEIKTPQ
ncbi:MAG: sialidase family protein [Bacteroidota bacterium]